MDTTSTCVRISSNLHCSQYLADDFLVSSNLDQNQADDAAIKEKFNQIYACPLVKSDDWLCHKYFPKCTNVDDENIKILKPCKYSCYAIRAPGSVCSGFSDTYINNECYESPFYNNPPDCYSLSIYYDNLYEEQANDIFISSLLSLFLMVLCLNFLRRRLLRRRPSNENEIILDNNPIILTINNSNIPLDP